MIFDNLIGHSADELELLRLISERVRAVGEVHKWQFFYMKLEKVGDGRSKIAWIRMFNDPDDYNNFQFSFEFYQAAIVVYPIRDGCKVALGGFTHVTHAQVYESHVKYSWLICKGLKNLESHRSPPRELIEGFFADFVPQFRAKAKRAS